MAITVAIRMSGVVVIALLGQIREAETGILFFVVSMDQALAIASVAIAIAAHAHAVAFVAPSCLHAASRLDARDEVGRNAVFGCSAEHLAAVGVGAREVEQVYTGEDDEEAAEEGDGVDGVGGVESAK